jgi:hypothetical protein
VLLQLEKVDIEIGPCPSVSMTTPTGRKVAFQPALQCVLCMSMYICTQYVLYTNVKYISCTRKINDLIMLIFLDIVVHRMCSVCTVCTYHVHTVYVHTYVQYIVVQSIQYSMMYIYIHIVCV